MTQYTYVGITAPGRELEELQGQLPAELETDQVLIKVAYSSLMPFDLYQLDKAFFVSQYPACFGLNGSGTIAKVGPGVNDLKEGDRVAALTAIIGKGLQEYTIQPRNFIAKIPDSISLEDAATLPDNFATGLHTLFFALGLPLSESDFPPVKAPGNADTPILVYGGGSTSAQYMVQLLKQAKYSNIVVAASPRHNEYLRGIGATHVVDYRSPSFAEDVAKAVGGDGKVWIAVDTIAVPDSSRAISKVIRETGGMVASLTPFKEGNDLTAASGEFLLDMPKESASLFGEGTKLIPVTSMLGYGDEKFARAAMPILLPRLIESGLIQPNEKIVLDGEHFVDRVRAGFALIREGKTAGKKVVIKVGA